MFLFFPLWRLFRPKMVTDTRIIERCNKKREPASSLTQFFFPIQHMGLGTLAMWLCLKISSSDFCDFFCGKKSPILRHTPLELQSYVARSRGSKFYLKSRSCFFLSFTWHFPATFKRQAVRQDVFFLCAFLNASCLLHNQQQLQQVNHLA